MEEPVPVAKGRMAKSDVWVEVHHVLGNCCPLSKGVRRGRERLNHMNNRAAKVPQLRMYIEADANGDQDYKNGEKW